MELKVVLNPEGSSNWSVPRIAILEDIICEREREDGTWGRAFDDRNTLNDWIAYASIYLGRAADMKAAPDEQRAGVLKTATILLAALEAFDRNGRFAPRHYDPENPDMTIPADPSRSRKIPF